MDSATRPGAFEHQPVTESGPTPASHPAASESATVGAASPRGYREDTDNRGLFQPRSKYAPEYRRDQHRESIYIFCLLAGSLLALGCLGLGFVDRFFAACDVPLDVIASCRRYEWIAAGGLLGGTVYAAKWLYHSIAKGLWHEDRRTWRFLSPWIALGVTVGIGTLVEAGFFRNSVEPVASQSGASLTGLGFLIGYLADRFLAKMRELMQVVFGETEAHYKRFKKRRQDNEP